MSSFTNWPAKQCLSILSYSFSASLPIKGTTQFTKSPTAPIPPCPELQPPVRAAFPAPSYAPKQDSSAQGFASWSSQSHNATPIFSSLPAPVLLHWQCCKVTAGLFFSPDQIKVCTFKISNTNKLSWMKHHLGSSQIPINIFSTQRKS